MSRVAKRRRQRQMVKRSRDLSIECVADALMANHWTRRRPSPRILMTIDDASVVPWFDEWRRWTKDGWVEASR